jgi:uncharacterized coiled-coil DUF342 family protein
MYSWWKRWKPAPASIAAILIKEDRSLASGGEFMTNKEHLVEQHIREYEARIKHIDELMQSADAALSGTAADSELSEELDSIKQARQQLHSHMEELQHEAEIAWSEKGGPMVMWDVVAERLEHLMERIGDWKTRH